MQDLFKTDRQDGFDEHEVKRGAPSMQEEKGNQDKPEVVVKRINTTKKGNRRQNACRKALEGDGWRVIVARRGYMGQPIDFFGLFDIIAYKPYMEHNFDTNEGEAQIWSGRFKLIQVKSNICDKKTRDAIEAFSVDGFIVSKEIWVYKDYDRSGPDIQVMA